MFDRNRIYILFAAIIVLRLVFVPHTLAFQAAEQCSPPLEERESESIWAGKQRLCDKIRKQPGYIPPDAYNSTGPVVWDTPIFFDENDLPELPADILPPAVRDYVLAVA